MKNMTYRTIAIATLLSAFISTTRAAIVGRYIYFSNPLSEAMELAEICVNSENKNIILKKPEVFTHGLEYSWYMLKRTPEQLQRDANLLVDGNPDPAQRVSFGSKVSAGYGDIELYYTHLELDLGDSQPLDSVTIHRSRYTRKLSKDLGWRLLLVLDEQRRVVSANTFNVYKQGWLKKNDGWTITLQPATRAAKGLVISEGLRSPISEAEYIRDFLGNPVTDLSEASSPENNVRLERFKQRNTPEALTELGKQFFQRVDLSHPSLKTVRKLVDKGEYIVALDAFKKPFFKALAPLADWNAGEGTSIYQHYSWVTEPDTLATCRARDLRNGLSANRNDLTVQRFIPGLLPPLVWIFLCRHVPYCLIML